MKDNPYSSFAEQEPPPLKLHVNCECGAVIPVRKTQAGSDVECGCGRIVEIPSLAELRRAAGLRGIEETIDGKVRRLVREGTLPGAMCVVCATPSQDVLRLICECERTAFKNQASSDWIVFFLISPMLGLLRLATRRVTYNVDQRGHDTVLNTPVRVCHGCYGDAYARWSLPVLRLLRLGLIFVAVLAFFAREPYWLPLLGALVVVIILEAAINRLHQAAMRRLRLRGDAYHDLLERFPGTVIHR